MNGYLSILLIILIIIIITYIEYKITLRKSRFNISCPKTFIELEHEGHKYLFYNSKYKNIINKRIKDTNIPLYKITPQITIPQKFKIILESAKINMLNINNIICSIVPSIASIFDLLTTTQKTKYRILTTNSDIEAITDEKNIFILSNQ